MLVNEQPSHTQATNGDPKVGKKLMTLQTSIEDAVSNHNTCDEWLRKAKEAKLIATHAREHLQKIKENVANRDHVKQACRQQVSELQRKAIVMR